MDRQGRKSPRLRVIGCCTLLLWAALCLPSPLYAQEGESDDVSAGVIDLGTLYVQETALEDIEILDRPTAFATVLDPRELSRRSLTLSEVLDSTPGVSVRSFGGLGSLSTISIRGMGSENVLVLLDDVPLNPTGGSVDLSDIPLDSLERIEIIRGGEGALTGAGAVGGVIRLTSLKAEDRPAVSRTGRFSGGSFRTVTSGFTLRQPGDLFHLELEGSRGEFSFLNDNGTSFEQGDDFIDSRENNEYSAGEARYAHAWELGRSRTLDFSGEWYRSEKGIPGITTFPSPHASQTDSRLFFQSAYSDPDFGDGKLDLSLGWLRQSRAFEDPLGESTGVPLSTSWVHNRLDAKAEWARPGFSKDDVLTTGASAALERLNAGEYGNPERDTFSAWLRDEWYLTSGAVLNGAVRCDLLDGDPTLSPRVGLKIPFDEGLTARANLGLDFRPPSFEELYRNEGLVVGNPDLSSERTLGFDMGLTHTSSDLRLEVDYFNLQTTDLIDYLLISGFRWKPYNVGRTRSSGIELSATWIIAPNWEFSGAFTRTRAVDTSGDPTRQGRPLVGQPSSDLFAELRWRREPWEAFANWQRRGTSAITPSGSRFLPPDSSTALGLGYTFENDTSLILEMKNFFDEDITDVRGFPLPGRSVFVTLRGEW